MVIPVDFAQVNFRFSGTACPTGAECTIGVALGTPADTPEIIAERFHVSFAAYILPALTNDVTLNSTFVKKGPDATGPSGEFVDPAPGEDDDNSLAPNTAYLVKKSTAQGGRSQRGRWYLPGVAEDAVDNSGVVVGGKIALLQEGHDLFRTAIEATGDILVLLHSDNGNDPDDIISMSVQPLVATQRRRLRR